MKPIRTALFSPGNRPERVRKALTLDADVVIIDLEDAVPVAEKEATRSLVRDALDAHEGKRLYVRVNDLSTSYCTGDVKSVVCGNLEGILFPKVESADHVFEIDRLLTTVERDNGLAAGILEVMILCESARGLEEIFSIVSAKPEHHRISMVAFGAADYTLDLGIALTREGGELDYARNRLPIASRAAGIMPPIDTPWMVDIKDIEGLKQDAKRAKARGFQGKLVIHPNQIEPCHEVFTPSKEEISQALEIIEAFEQSEREGKAAIQLHGKFIDYPVVEKAKRIHALAEAIAPPA